MEWRRSKSLSQSRGGGSQTGAVLESRNTIVDTIMGGIFAVLGAARLKLIDDYVADDATAMSTALDKAIKLVHATPCTLAGLGSGLVAFSIGFTDVLKIPMGRRKLWLTTSIRRAVEHTLDTHLSAVSRAGMRIILAGPGAPNWFHLSILKQPCGAARGFDAATYHSLPFTNAAKTAMGADTMVLDVASPETATPWRVTLVNDSLLSKTQTEAAANRNKRKWEELTGTAACKKAAYPRHEGNRDRGQRQPYNFWKGDMWNGM